MRFTRLALVLPALLIPTAAHGQSAIDKAAWLAGCWEAKSPSRTVIEMWMAPDGGLMLGASRSVANGTLREFEHLRLRAAGANTLIYTALPSGQNQTDFKGIPADGVLTFDNPAHDFPKRIIYRRIGADSAIARVEGDGKGFNFPMKRVACGPTGT